MKIVVTGGSGFIGTNLIEKFLSEGFEVLNIDIEEPKIKERKNIWKKIDILDYKELEKNILNFNPDYIVHLAARTDLEGKTLDDYKSNQVGTVNIVNISNKIQKLKKVVLASSMLVCHTGYIPKNDFDYCPTTLYGESKMLGEKEIWTNPPSCDWAIIRPTSIWGPWFGIPYRNFFDMVIAKKYFHIGHKSCTKTYGYVGNAVYEIEQIMLHDTSDKNSKVFYIGDYEPTNIEKWGNEIAEQLGYKIIRMPYWLMWCAAKFGDVLKIMKIRFPMTSFRLKNMTTDNVIDMERTRRIAGESRFSRPEGIKETLKWLKD